MANHFQISVVNDNLKPIFKETILSDHRMLAEPNAFGPYMRLAIVQTTNPEILDAAQNGGAVTGLLTFALETGIIDGAIVSAVSATKPFSPMPFIARTSAEILENAGTRYTYSPGIQALSQAADGRMRKLAFVGTPCQIAAVRRMQQTKSDRARIVKLLIGLMCSEAFSYEDLMVNYVQDRLGIDLHNVRKTKVVADKMVIVTNDGQTTLPLVDIKKYARKNCVNCFDFSSELADISAGGLGLGNWTFVIIRTPIGEKVFSEAERARALVSRPVQMHDPPVKLLMRLSRKKHDREDIT